MSRLSHTVDCALELGAILKKTSVAWLRQDCPRRAASVAYFGAFTLAPLLIVMTGIFSLMLSHEWMRGTLVEEIRNLAGSQASDLTERLLTNMAQNNSGLWGTVVGVTVSIFAATTLFSQLQHHMNQIWDVKSRPGKGFLVFMRSRLISFVCILVIGLLLLGSLLIDTALVAFRDAFSEWLPGKIGLVQWGNVTAWLGLSILIFASMFKFMPDIKIRWREVLPGAVVTAVLFSAGRQLVGLYLGKSAAVSAYGAAGSLAIILFWVYYTCLVFLFGVQFCRTYQEHHQRPIRTNSIAIQRDQEAD